MVVTRRISVQTRGNGDLVDITPEVGKALRETGLREGVVTLFVAHTTAALTIIEPEEGLLEDLRETCERLAPLDLPYRHNRIDDNGHAHLRASILGQSVTVPFTGGALTLGTWQHIMLADFDTRPRRREVVLQFLGEKG